METREVLARVVRGVGVAGALVLLWQAVRFCQGQVDAPALDTFRALVSQVTGGRPTLGDAMPLHWISWACAELLVFVAGVGEWIILAGVFAAACRAVARIVEVGWAQYRAEEGARTATDRRVEAYRQRRELRRQRRASLRQKPSNGVGLLLLGLLLGSWL